MPINEPPTAMRHVVIRATAPPTSAALPRRRLALLALLALLAAPAHAEMNERSADLTQIKVAYLLKFSGFVEWPADAFASPASPLVIGVAGADELADDLAQGAAGHTAGGRRLVVRKLRAADPPAAVHLLYLGNLDKSRLLDIYTAVKGRPVLTVSDAEQAGAQGSMISFVVSGERLRFEVALKPVELCRLKISALMLASAARVSRGMP